MAKVLACHQTEQGQRLEVVLGDLTEERVDAIVNAANENLAHGGGVAGAIVRRGGAIIQEESDRIAPVPTGSAKSTGAGNLPCRRVLHAVGPVWQDGQHGEPALLARAVRAALEIAAAEKLARISLPAISSGIFGFPKERCAEVLTETVLAFFQEHPDGPVRVVRFCNFDEPTTEVFLREFRRRGLASPGGDDN